ncbi:MAG: sporulation protein YqfD [Clostridiales bacterium]|nr:sporulation protein YqfD [Clostridiales bacterium]
MSIFDFFRGLYKVKIPKSAAKQVVSLMVSSKLPFGEISENDDGYEFFLRGGDVAKMNLIANKVGVEIKTERTGFPAIAHRYRKRFGIPVGAALMILIIVFSSKFVWDIRISGNESISAESIEQTLDGYGLKLGAFVPSLDGDLICRKIVIERPDISWATVNLRGTVADVEIREAKSAGVDKISSPSNIVALCDGQIVSVEAYGGKSEVSSGQTVKKGDLLISGVINSNALGYRLVRSRGKVFAKVSKTFSASVPLEITVKTPTGRSKTEKNTIFFSKNLNLFKNINISYEKYDTIVKTERKTLFGKNLPVSVMTVTYSEYTETTRRLDEKEALDMAKEQIAAQLANETKSDEILAKYESYACDGETLTLTVVVECVCEIGEEKTIVTEQK